MFLYGWLAGWLAGWLSIEPSSFSFPALWPICKERNQSPLSVPLFGYIYSYHPPSLFPSFPSPTPFHQSINNNHSPSINNNFDPSGKKTYSHPNSYLPNSQATSSYLDLPQHIPSITTKMSAGNTGSSKAFMNSFGGSRRGVCHPILPVS